jgi:hypothetical protein
MCVMVMTLVAAAAVGCCCRRQVYDRTGSLQDCEDMVQVRGPQHRGTGVFTSNVQAHCLLDGTLVYAFRSAPVVPVPDCVPH